MSRVLVTGAGGPAGVAVVAAASRLGHHVVAVDSEALSAGLHLAPDAAVVAGAADPDRFVRDLVEAVDKFDVDIVVPTVVEEMVAIGERPGRIDAATWVPAPTVVVTCSDKWRFWNELSSTDVPLPVTALGDQGAGRRALAELVDRVPGPWIVKPRSGRGSRDVLAVDTPGDLAWACARVPRPIVQTRVAGREFTADVLTALDGTVAAVVPRWRLETRAGISTKGRTFDDPDVVAVAGRTVAAVGLHGVANVQGFVTDDGDVVVVEVNPRFSGGLPLSLAAGADLVGEYLRGCLGLPVRPERLGFRPGVTMLRHFAEVYTG